MPNLRSLHLIGKVKSIGYNLEASQAVVITVIMKCKIPITDTIQEIKPNLAGIVTSQTSIVTALQLQINSSDPKILLKIPNKTFLI